MKKTIITILHIFLTIILFHCRAQPICESTTLGEVFESLKDVNPDKKVKLRFKEYPSFNFSKFIPFGEEENEDAIYKVGYNERNEIEEIVYEAKNVACTTFTMLVYNYDKYKILLVKENIDKQTFYHVIAFVILKNGKIFMFNLNDQFYDKGYIQRTKTFFKGSIDSMSAIMTLDDRLRPIELFKFAEKQLVWHSFFVYNKDRSILKYESVSFSFNTLSRPSIIIDSSLCLLTLDDNKVMDYNLKLYPNKNGCSSDPLWLYHGAHSYRNCID